jgi:hypothetical protein
MWAPVVQAADAPCGILSSETPKTQRKIDRSRPYAPAETTLESLARKGVPVRVREGLPSKNKAICLVWASTL